MEWGSFWVALDNINSRGRNATEEALEREILRMEIEQARIDEETERSRAQ